MSILKPNDLKIIITQSLIYIYRSEENKIKDECCGFWTFINLNENNELIISSFQKNPSETWALEWYSKKEGGFGWFPYCDKKYPLKMFCPGQHHPINKARRCLLNPAFHSPERYLTSFLVYSSAKPDLDARCPER